eukprot:1806782-Pyramimonas_sp.AAC.1
MIWERHCDVHARPDIAVFAHMESVDDFKNWFQALPCQHILGPFLSSWSEYWRGDGSEDSRFGPAAFADLWSVKVMFQEDTAAIEDGHASIRRDVVIASTQTHSPKLFS